MANLRDRLNRIKETNKTPVVSNVQKEAENRIDCGVNNLLADEWKNCGFKVLKREIISKLIFSILDIPKTISIIVSDFIGNEGIKNNDLVYFDLETTGLGGSGTVAFLASFGRLSLFQNSVSFGTSSRKSGRKTAFSDTSKETVQKTEVFEQPKLVITQYLLLDYPGEVDFLNLITAELEKENAMIVTYNGKSFDCQIVKSRCLINRLKTPKFKHADLLHPARRLWKNIIQDCSQGSVESNILGKNRIDDIPGALAPEIWFEFVRTGKIDRLKGICNHNILDIEGLALIFEAMKIIGNDFNTEIINYDKERLAITFYKYAYYKIKNGEYKEPLQLIDCFIDMLDKENFWQLKLIRRKNKLLKIAEI